LYNKIEFAGIFISKLKIYNVFRDTLSICQLHILLSRTAQISLELHFCVELHTKKALRDAATASTTFSQLTTESKTSSAIHCHNQRRTKTSA